jgi:hypothetical protein
LFIKGERMGEIHGHAETFLVETREHRASGDVPCVARPVGKRDGARRVTVHSPPKE